MACKYRAYKGGQGFSAHDSDMPKQTWEKVRKRVDCRGLDGGLRNIDELKAAGWRVKKVEVPHARPTPTRVNSEVMQQVARHETQRYHIGWLILFVVLGILILGLGLATILG